jgi:hypothetical protein
MRKLYIFIFVILTICFIAHKNNEIRARVDIVDPVLNSLDATIEAISTNDSQITAITDGDNASAIGLEGRFYVKKYKKSKRDNLGSLKVYLDNEKRAPGFDSISDSNTLYITYLTDAAKITTKKLLL